MPATATVDRRSTPVAAIPRQRRLPVGARFPRSWPVLDIARDTTVSRPERNRAPVFPVGCRFPRRTAADVLTYLAAAVPAAPGANRNSMPPVGARFPRRPRPTTTGTVAAPAAPALTAT